MFKNLETALLQPWPRIWLQEIDSTNAEACRRIARGELGPTWIAARSQTSGRGRRGREWLSETGNLFTTAYFPLERSPAFAGLVCFTTCISLRAALGELGVDVSEIQYKWPNDLRWRGRKLSGILIETSPLAQDALAMCVGVGVNIISAPDTDQKTACVNNLPSAASSLSADGLLEAFAECFKSELISLLTNGFDQTRLKWLDHAEGLNETISVTVGAERISGILIGLDADGSLVMQMQDGQKRRITAGDVQLIAD